MDLDRSRKLIKSLFEHVPARSGALGAGLSDDPAINDLIEKTIGSLPEAQQGKYLDALECLKDAGRAGLTAQEWMNAYRAIRPHEGEGDDGKDVVQDCARIFFGQVVEKIRSNGPSKFRWILDGTHEVPAEMRHGVESLVDVSSEMMRHAERMETFTAQSLARAAMTVGIDSNAAYAMAVQFLMHHQGMFERVGPDEYRMKSADKKRGRGTTDYSQMFRDIANSTPRLGGGTVGGDEE